MAWNSFSLCSGSRDRSILQRDVRSPDQHVRKMVGHRQEVCGLRWSPDEHHLASGGNDNRLVVWRNGYDVPVHRFTQHTAAVKAIAWSPHQHGLLASGGGTADQKIRFWNTLTSQPLQCIDTKSQVRNTIPPAFFQSRTLTGCTYNPSVCPLSRSPALPLSRSLKSIASYLIYAGLRTIRCLVNHDSR